MADNGGHEKHYNGLKPPFGVCIEIPPRGIEPLEENSQPIINKGLTKNQEPVFAVSLDILLQKYPDLKAIIEVWPELPENIKEAIKALINTNTGKAECED